MVLQQSWVIPGSSSTYFSVTTVEHSDQKKLREERLQLILPGHNPSVRKAMAGTQAGTKAETMEEGC